ncbi:MAG: HupE/UreJ family protein [Usitatibacter sp.]
MRWPLLAGIALAFLARIACAHDIPNDVRVQAFVKPEGRTLQLLVRVPMSAMREADIPLVGPGFIDMARAQGPLRTAARLWLVDNIEVYEGDSRIGAPTVAAARVALASDKSFESYERALATVRSPPLTDNDLYWRQQFVDVLLEYPIASERSDFAIRPRMGKLGLQVLTVLRFLPPGGPERAFEIHGDGELVHLDPRWHHAALRFVEMGFRHILDGTDHLLFIACLVIPFRRLRPLIVIATAFTVAHSITLSAAAFGLAPAGLWFPPLVEVLIAASIVYMALENIVGSNAMRRWMIAFAFGLVHGFGFAFALRESLQFAGSHLVTALFAFNVGVELGQVAVLLVLVPALNLLFRYIPEKVGVIILSALIAHTAWHWMTERFDELRRFPLPALDAAAAASLMRWAMAAIALAFVVWLVDGKVRRWLRA